MGLLYKDKEVSFSNIEAIKNGCPRRVYVAFADDGPRVLSSMSMESERPREKEDAPPILEWQPPCSFWQGEFGFDGVPVASVPKGAAEPDGAGCRDAARASLIDGTSIGRYSTRYLAVGERFCEGFESADGSRVILLRVVKVSGSPVVEEITLAATMWAGPAAEEKAEATGGLPQPGDKVYENVPFRLVESIAKANDCGVGTVGLGGSRPGISFHNGPGLMLSGTGDIGYFPGCLNGNPKLRFGAYVGRVQGGADPDLAACQDIAARGSRESLDVLVSDLRLGDRFCIFNSGEDFVALVKVTELSATDPVSVTFSATRWEAPGPS
ncbi:hypothetical protein ACFYY8_11165 [Streptosporangium sp. NPDC001559]|uniref:hypothetical protein n=1 Tax=Streptosporangium sp. NPDC001559 TaxID=3366187 RepID=UPI0036ED13A2